MSSTTSSSSSALEQEEEEFDVVVIGSGIGGLSGAGLAATYGYRVAVCESHYLAGGVCHSFEIDGYKFDAGPSLWAGMGESSTNPLRQVLDVTGAAKELDWISYDGWGMHIPEGYFRFKVGPGVFEDVLRQYGGEKDVMAWRLLNDAMRPLLQAAVALPPMALRGDLLAGVTLVPYLFGALKAAGLGVTKLENPFTEVMDGIVEEGSFLYHWLDYLSFALSGLPAAGTQAAAVIYTIGDLHRPGCNLDYPAGGGGAVIDAMVRAIESKGGEVKLKTHVQNIIVEDGEAKGVLLKNGRTIRAKKAVISNASIWDTVDKLLPSELGPQSSWGKDKMETPDTGSFMHLHLGIDATDLEGLDIHYSIVESWEEPIDAPMNMFIVSIPTVLDPSLAPPGKHLVHIYTAGNEPFSLWEGLKRGSSEYKALKKERAEYMWKALERIIPDIRKRTEVELVGSPLTHQYFNRRFKGSYGPGNWAGREKFPGPKLTPEIKKLLHCGDSCLPGLGLPAVAASGMSAANTLVSVRQQQELMEEMRRKGFLVNRFTDF